MIQTGISAIDTMNRFGTLLETFFLYTLSELILARTYFGEFGGLVEFLFKFKLVMWPSAKLSSRQNKCSLNVSKMYILKMGTKGYNLL